jgi:putative redox protein
MKIRIDRVNQAYNLKAFNEDGCEVSIDASPEIGGGNNGMRPMQLLISALGGCSSIDIISILKKQRQDLKDLKVEIHAEREQDKTPSLFTAIHVHFILYGNIDTDKARKAVELSMGKYCSVAKILEKTAKINYDFKILSFNE